MEEHRTKVSSVELNNNNDLEIHALEKQVAASAVRMSGAKFARLVLARVVDVQTLASIGHEVRYYAQKRSVNWTAD